MHINCIILNYLPSPKSCWYFLLSQTKTHVSNRHYEKYSFSGFAKLLNSANQRRRNDFDSRGANSNRFSIYLSVLFCDPPNFGGWGVKPLQPPSNVVFDKLPALENASGADVVQGHKVKTLWGGHKIGKKSPKTSCFYSVVSKQVGDFFKFLWPSQRSWTLKAEELCLLRYHGTFAAGQSCFFSMHRKKNQWCLRN